MEYHIHEANIERLEKKLTTIKNKCEKYGIEFRYERKGEEFKEVEVDGVKQTVKYILVEAEGKAIKNGWEFVATLHHEDNGNIICGYGNIEVPEKYYNCEAVCEHCNSNRRRKDTYIVYNAETKEFKQVGRNCLKDFTFGLDAEQVTAYISGFDELIKGEAIEGGRNFTRYFNLKEMLCYFNETIKHFGFVRSQDYGESTASRAHRFYDATHGSFGLTQKVREDTLKEMEKVNFDADTEENKTKVEAMIKWVEEIDTNNNYFHNLKVICKQTFVEGSDFGIVASLPATYDRELEREAERRQKELENKLDKANSKYIGNVGERITFNVESYRCLSAHDTQWGISFFYELRDTVGNVIVWSTSNSLDDDVKAIKATVKAHQEYKGVKQTVVTRCSVLKEAI